MKDFPDSSSFPAKWIDRLDNRKNPINVLLSFHLRLNIIGGREIKCFFSFSSRVAPNFFDSIRNGGSLRDCHSIFNTGVIRSRCPRDELGVGSISTRRVVRSLRNRSLSRATSFPFFSPSFLPPPTNEKRENSGEAREETLQETSNNRRKLHKISGATLGRFSAEERGGGGGGRIENVIKDNEASFPC